MELIDTIKKDLKETLSERRYIHSIGVMEMCAKLAQIYEVDVQKAQIAGLLHDIAKEMPKEEMFKYVEENNIEITEIEKISYQILHGKIGADIAKKKYGLDEQIQNAITSPEMDTLAKIVYVSDKIEMNRKSEGYDLEYERELAQKDLDKTVLYIIDASIKSLVEKGKLIEKEVDTRNYLILKNLNR